MSRSGLNLSGVRMFAIRFLSILSVCLLPSCHEVKEQPVPQPSQPILEQIVGPETLPIATVNGVDVSLERFNTLYNARISRIRLRRGEISQVSALNIKAVVAGQLIDELLLQQAARQRDIVVSDDDLNLAVQQLANSFPDQKIFQVYLAVSNGEQALRDRLRIRLLKELLIGIKPASPIKVAELMTTLRAEAKIENHLFQRYFQADGAISFAHGEGQGEGGIGVSDTLPSGLPIGPGPGAIGSIKTSKEK